MSTTACVRALFPERSEAGEESAAASQADASHRERQYYWGRLISRSPPPAAGQPAPDKSEDKVYNLVSTKEYMVGRSRKSDIRIGHTAPMPYISSQHFRIYHAIRWPDATESLGSEEEGEKRPAPVLQAWLEDLSQNGTFINGQLVGRNKHQPLSEGDRIEMVFPQGRQPPQGGNSFPVFTYVPYRPAAGRATSPRAVSAAGR